MQVKKKFTDVSRSFSTKIPKVPGVPFLGIFNKVNTDILHSQLDELAADYEKVVQFDIGPFTYNLITDSNMASQILEKQVTTVSEGLKLSLCPKFFFVSGL